MFRFLFCFRQFFLLSFLLGFSIAFSQDLPGGHLVLDRVTKNCFLNVLKQGEKIFFSIPDSVLDRDILVATRIVKAGQDLARPALNIGGFPGVLTIEDIVRFSKKGAGNIVLQFISYERHTNAHPSSRKIQKDKRVLELMEFSQAELAGVNTIEVTGLLDGLNNILFINDFSKRTLKIGDTSSIRTTINSIRGYPVNLEIGTVGTRQNKLLFELNTSLLLLPKLPMRPRFHNASLNFFKQPVTNIDGLAGISDSPMITKWRLEPKISDIMKYKRGELVDPQKPIVFYIDPEVPAKWVPYFKKGVTDWNKAFEKAGFKNAIIAKEVDKGNQNFSIDDIQNSVIHLVNSEIKNGVYPTIVDPRSGEILQSHVIISTGGIQLQCENYFVQASPSDSRARKHIYDDTLLGSLIVGFVSHEVGHALGLDHNMIASDYTPVEKLRDNKWLTENDGHTVSIMDYARFNYVAQPGDRVNPIGLLRHIGAYDLWAIKWGYSFFPNEVPDATKIEILTQWINESASDKKYRFYTYGNDPRAVSEALSDNLVQAADYGIKNLKFVISHMADWITSSGGNPEDISILYKRVLLQLEDYVRHVAANIGGVYDTIGRFPGGFVPGYIQERALGFLNREIFNTPLWLKDPRIIKYAKSPDSSIFEIQSTAIGTILTTRVLVNLLAAEKQPALNIFALADYLQKIHKYVCSELYTTQPIDKFSQNLQKKYAQILMSLLKPYSRWNWPEGTKMDTYSAVTSLVRHQFMILQNDIQNAIQRTDNPATLEHLARIQKILNVK
jgi:hypothetical protein